jgi:peptidoglycan/xylan/chitin deacetylase (PgdA/CDA1 family)
MRSQEPLLKVLLYHHIEPQEMTNFKRQIDYIAKRYDLLSPEDLPGFFERLDEHGGVKVMLTFDDGFRSNLHVAQEVLSPRGIRAIFFVCPKLLGIYDREQQKEFISAKVYIGRIKAEDVPDSFVPMDWDDARKLIAMGHTIGAHTMNHCRLSEVGSEEELRHEIIESGNKLEKNLGVRIHHFAFPFGNINSIDRKSMDVIRKRYEYCYSAIRGNNYTNTNPYAILRDPVLTNDKLGYVRFIVENGLRLMYGKRALLLKNLSADHRN